MNFHLTMKMELIFRCENRLLLEKLIGSSVNTAAYNFHF